MHICAFQPQSVKIYLIERCWINNVYDVLIFVSDATEQNRDSQMNLTRYLTYAGLCIATCIIFQKNTIAASVIGLSVALYISVSEYFLSSSKPSDLNSAFDIGKLFDS